MQECLAHSPRINSYVTIPSEAGYIVGQIEWIAIERSPFPKRKGFQDYVHLVLSSQRPSEISSTVLSQCNSFLLHRISNDRNQELVNKLVPDSFRGLLRELPSLTSQNAILLGWASELPVMVKMNHLSREKRPHSDDPDFWDVWTGKNDKRDARRDVNWKKIADEWQRKNVSTNGNEDDLDASAT